MQPFSLLLSEIYIFTIHHNTIKATYCTLFCSVGVWHHCDQKRGSSSQLFRETLQDGDSTVQCGSTWMQKQHIRGKSVPHFGEFGASKLLYLLQRLRFLFCFCFFFYKSTSMENWRNYLLWLPELQPLPGSFPL